MFTSSQDIQVYINKLKQKYNDVRQRYVSKVQPITSNSSLYGLNLPFLNLSQNGKTIQVSSFQIGIHNNDTLRSNNSQSESISRRSCSLFNELQQKDHIDPKQNYQSNQQKNKIKDQFVNKDSNKENYPTIIITPFEIKRKNKKKVTIKQLDISDDNLGQQKQGQRQSLTYSSNSPFRSNTHKSILKGSYQKLKQLKNIEKEDCYSQFNLNQGQNLKANNYQKDNINKDQWKQNLNQSLNNRYQVDYQSLFNIAKTSNSQFFDQTQFMSQTQKTQNNQGNRNEDLSLNNSMNFETITSSLANPIQNTLVYIQDNYNFIDKTDDNNNSYSDQRNKQQKQKTHTIFEDQSQQSSIHFCQSQSRCQSFQSDIRIKDQISKLPFLQTIIQKSSDLYQQNLTTERDYSDKVYQQINRFTDFTQRQKSFQNNYYQMIQSIRKISTICMKKQKQENQHISNLQDLQYNINKSVSMLKRGQLKYQLAQNCFTFGALV